MNTSANKFWQCPKCKNVIAKDIEGFESAVSNDKDFAADINRLENFKSAANAMSDPTGYADAIKAHQKHTEALDSRKPGFYAYTNCPRCNQTWTTLNIYRGDHDAVDVE